MPGRPNEDRYAAGEECLCQALAGLAVAGQHQAENAARHIPQQLPVRLHAHGVQRVVPVGAGDLRRTRRRSGRPDAGAPYSAALREPAQRARGSASWPLQQASMSLVSSSSRPASGLFMLNTTISLNSLPMKSDAGSQLPLRNTQAQHKRRPAKARPACRSASCGVAPSAGLVRTGRRPARRAPRPARWNPGS